MIGWHGIGIQERRILFVAFTGRLHGELVLVLVGPTLGKPQHHCAARADDAFSVGHSQYIALDPT